MKITKILLVFLLSACFANGSLAQISPGKLTKAHANLEGVANCTQCHTLGHKVSSQKCLDCHKEIRDNQQINKGFHASKEVMSKECVACHKEHHGREFKLTKFDEKKFDHAKTGFVLKGMHAKKDCKSCHKAEFMVSAKYKKIRGTYMGLSSKCTSCHFDYHQNKMPANCATCHGFESFKNPKIKGFDHNKTNYPLLGKHIPLKCNECHKTEMLNGKKIQRFTSLPFKNCTPCHKDAHDNRFGQDCKRCHTEESFHKIKNLSSFDHDKTAFKLLGMHRSVDCKKCHKTANMTDPLKHNRCSDCHADFHKGEFAKNGVSPDCNECHTNNSFRQTSFTIERHNKLKFKLEGAHIATACYECHRKNGTWKFRNIPSNCIDCHANVHKGEIEKKYMPKNDCAVCHTVKNWITIKPFNHDPTGYKLVDAHAKIACSACHYPKNESGVKEQRFDGTPRECSACHKDNHVGQFEENGSTDCAQCHGIDRWVASKFDHNTSRFKLDGNHAKAKCEDCHREVKDEKGKYIQYKFKSIACSTCHS